MQVSSTEMCDAKTQRNHLKELTVPVPGELGWAEGVAVGPESQVTAAFFTRLIELHLFNHGAARNPLWSNFMLIHLPVSQKASFTKTSTQPSTCQTADHMLVD